MLRNVFKTLLLLVVIGCVVYFDYGKLFPCSRPITYRIGELDPAFGVSQGTFIADITQAADIWDTSINKTLFVYDPKGKLVVNLVYDSRQATTQEEQSLNSSIDAEKRQADMLKGQYTMLEAKHASVAEINASINQYNAVVNSINSSVHTINNDGLTGTQFEEGLYVSSATGTEITIYQFDNQTLFIRTIAHELGHALGLDHNQNPDSIMNPVNSSRNLVPTVDDLAELKAACRI